MDVIDRLVEYGFPVVLVAAGAGTLWSAIRTDASDLPGPRAYWLWLGMLVIWTEEGSTRGRRGHWTPRAATLHGGSR